MLPLNGFTTAVLSSSPARAKRRLKASRLLPIIVIIGSNPGSGSIFNNRRRLLAQRGMRVLLIDVRF